MPTSATPDRQAGDEGEGAEEEKDRDQGRGTCRRRSPGGWIGGHRSVLWYERGHAEAHSPAKRTDALSASPAAGSQSQEDRDLGVGASVAARRASGTALGWEVGHLDHGVNGEAGIGQAR